MLSTFCECLPVVPHKHLLIIFFLFQHWCGWQLCSLSQLNSPSSPSPRFSLRPRCFNFSEPDWVLRKSTTVFLVGCFTPALSTQHTCLSLPKLSACIVFSEDKDLLPTVAELKYAHHRLNEQNSSLLRTVAQCEDANLQLSLEITELRAKLARWRMTLLPFTKLQLAGRDDSSQQGWPVIDFSAMIKNTFEGTA